MSKNKVTLVWSLYDAPSPKTVRPNLSLALLSKVLEAEGIEVDCIDCNLLFYVNWKQNKLGFDDRTKILSDFAREVERTNPSVVGIGSWTHLTPFAIEMAKVIKSRNPNVFVVLGGSNPTVLPDETLQIAPHVDCLIRGEGEHTLLELVRALDSGKNWKKIKSISFLDDGKVINNPPRDAIKKIDTLPIIDFENFIDFKAPNSFYLMTSRSCPYNCIFCSVKSTLAYYRPHSPDYVIRQIRHLRNLYDADAFSFEDDDFIANRERAIKLAKLIGKEGIRTAAAGRSDEISTRIVRALKKSNFNEINMGVESVVPKTLCFLNKSQNPEEYLRKTKKSIKILKKEKMEYGLFFIVGAPVETKADMEETLKFVEDNYTDASRMELGYLKLHPGTPLWEKYKLQEIGVFRMNRASTALSFGYDHLVWMTPDLYLVRSNYYPDIEYAEIITDILNRFYEFGR